MLKKLLSNVNEGIDHLLSLWGMLFRAIFILVIGYIGFNWIDPQNIFDIPLAQLTLGAIIGAILATGIVIGCISWFFHFPEQSSKEDESPYIQWAQGSFWLFAIAIMAYFLWFRRH